MIQAQIGFKFTMLDIGGGFPGAPDAAITFEEVSCQNASKTHLRNVSFLFSFLYLQKASQGVSSCFKTLTKTL